MRRMVCHAYGLQMKKGTVSRLPSLVSAENLFLIRQASPGWLGVVRSEAVLRIPT